MKHLQLFLLLFLLIGRAVSAQTPQIEAGSPWKLPEIPTALTQPTERAEYLAAHYWDTFDFTAPALLGETTEQHFADFLAVLPHTAESQRKAAVIALLDRTIGGNEVMLPYFADLFEKYLWDTESPMRDMELYLPVLQFIVGSPAVGETEKLRPHALLGLAERNRIGQPAEEFGFVLPNGREMRLSQIEGDYLLLFFNSPDCAECLLAKSTLATSTIIGNTPGLAIVAVHPRGEESIWRGGRYPSAWINGRDSEQAIDSKGLYDLRELPSIYLLDRDKRVLLKNATVREVETYLKDRAVR